MFCTKCGNKVNDNMKFCTMCGAPLARPKQRVENQIPRTSKKGKIFSIIGLAASIYAIFTTAYLYYLRYGYEAKDSQGGRLEKALLIIFCIIMVFVADAVTITFSTMGFTKSKKKAMGLIGLIIGFMCITAGLVLMSLLPTTN